eukprot:SAG11_NODE_658_length_7897_cov_13.075789_10_plen_130_part_00
MSFVILKNNNQQAANSFINQFTDTLTIPRNSEVALHSMSLNRLQQYAVEDWSFYIYHGPELDEDGDPVDGGPDSVQQPTEIHLTNGAYTVDELACTAGTSTSATGQKKKTSTYKKKFGTVVVFLHRGLY